MKISLKELVLFSLLGAVICASKYAMELLPNVHLVGVFVVAITAVYRKKALYPIYAFVFLTGLLSGFAIWWIPYLYIWTVLWGATMLLPRNMPAFIAPIVYIAVCALHGFAYGLLYSPFQAFMFGLDFEGLTAWVVAGLPFDIVHGISNIVCGLLIYPIIMLLKNIDRYTDKN